MKIATFTMIKNEQLYLKEWIEHNLMLGFDEIWLAEDYDSKSHKEITDAYPEVHYVSLKDDMKIMPWVAAQQRQYRANQYMINYLKKERGMDWVAPIDIDEFICYEGDSLKDVLKQFEPYKGVYMAWKMYGANGHVKRVEDASTMQAYTKLSPCIAEGDWTGKVFVNCNKITDSDQYRNVHLQYGAVDVNFEEVTNVADTKLKMPTLWHTLWENHYFTKSWEDWLIRLGRGNMQNNYRKVDTFFKHNPDMRSKRAELIKEYNV